MDLLKKHVDTVIVLGAIFSVFLWMNSRFSDIDKKFSDIEGKLIRIETVLIIKGIMPEQMAAQKFEQERHIP